MSTRGRRNVAGVVLVMAMLAPAAHADAFDDAAVAYKRGDYEKAASMFEVLADKGDHRAMAALASMYAAGRGVEQNQRRAFLWFREAARYNRADAQYRLGLMYDAGLGVKSNQRKAVRWYRKAARQGYLGAYVMMGLKYLEGVGFEQDKVRAYAWLSLARPHLEALRDAAPTAMVVGESVDPVEVLEKIAALEQELDAEALARGRELAKDYAPKP